MTKMLGVKMNLSSAFGFSLGILFVFWLNSVEGPDAYAQQGNGVIVNATGRELSVSIRGKSASQQRQFNLKQGDSVFLRNFPGYECDLLNERVRYDVDAQSKDNTSPWNQKIYSLRVADNGRVVLTSGPSEQLGPLAEAFCQSRAATLQGKWEQRIDADHGIAVTNSSIRRFKTLALEEHIQHTYGIDLRIMGPDLILATSCSPIDAEVADYFKRLIAKSLDLNSSKLQLRSVCCSRARSDFTLDDLKALVDQLPGPAIKTIASITSQKKILSYNTGKFAGIDGTESPLDLAAIEYQRVRHIAQNPHFSLNENLIKWVEAEISQILCTISDTALNNVQRSERARKIQTRIDSIYGYGILKGTTVLPQFEVLMDDDSLVRAVTYDASGNKMERMATSWATAPPHFLENISIEAVGVTTVEVRSNGYCIAANNSRKQGKINDFPETWEPLVTGKDGRKWCKGTYCLRVGNLSAEPRIFVIDPASNHKYTITPTHVSSEELPADTSLP